jgi:hypothetical protein
VLLELRVVDAAGPLTPAAVASSTMVLPRWPAVDLREVGLAGEKGLLVDELRQGPPPAPSSPPTG